MNEERKMLDSHAKCKSQIINEIDLSPWTDDELDYLDRIGQNTITLDESVGQTNKTEEEIHSQCIMMSMDHALLSLN